MSSDDYTSSTTDVIRKKIQRCLVSLYMTMRYQRWTVKHFTLVGGFILAICTFFISYHLVFSLELLPWHPTVDHWCESEEVPQYMLRASPDEMTIVTMFLDLGVFKKGEQPFAYHSPYKYRRWMRVYGRMVNRVVAFMENDDDIAYFREIRSCLPESLTKIIKVSQSDLPSFKHLPQIKNIYSRPSYPKHHPNTVYGEYACAMHAKYDVLERSCEADFFKTPYFAWLDIGLFRDLDRTSHDLFKLVPPAKFNPESVGFTQAFPRDPVFPVEMVMKENLVWVSGAMVVATKEYMLNFTRDYQAAVSELLKKGLSNTDQQVIYAMYSIHMRKPHYPKIKTYLCHNGQLGLKGSGSRYFCLGYVCKDAWEGRVPHLSQPQAQAQAQGKGPPVGNA